jgi:hypothetical protein
MNDNLNTNPSILWAQDKTHIFLTLEVENIREQNIDFQSSKIIFKGSSKDTNYLVTVDLSYDIDNEKCDWSINQTSVKIILKKVKHFFWNRLTKQKQNNIKIDWSKWIEEDESEDSDEENEMISNFNDFKKNIPSEILEKDFKELFSPDDEITDNSDSETNYDASGEMSSSLIEDIDKVDLDNIDVLSSPEIIDDNKISISDEQLDIEVLDDDLDEIKNE